MYSNYLLGFFVVAFVLATGQCKPAQGGTILVYHAKNGEDLYVKAYPKGYKECMKKCANDDGKMDLCDLKCKDLPELKDIFSNCTTNEYDQCVDYCKSLGIKNTICFGDGNCLCVDKDKNTLDIRQVTDEECDDCDTYCDQLPSQEIKCSPPYGCECDSTEIGTLYLLNDKNKCTPADQQDCEDRCIDNGYKGGVCLIPGLCSCQ